MTFVSLKKDKGTAERLAYLMLAVKVIMPVRNVRLLEKSHFIIIVIFFMIA